MSKDHHNRRWGVIFTPHDAEKLRQAMSQHPAVISKTLPEMAPVICIRTREVIA